MRLHPSGKMQIRLKPDAKPVALILPAPTILRLVIVPGVLEEELWRLDPASCCVALYQ